jgi:hypothetical protein
VELASERSFAARRNVVYLAAAVSVLLTNELGSADPLPVAPSNLNSIFLVAKNENKNQVHYGVHVDRECHVIGTRPLYGYWRMLEKNGAIEPMLSREIRAYGIDPVQRIETIGDTTTIETRLNAIPDRLLRVTVARKAGECSAEASMVIGGADARLRLIYVRIGWAFGVDYILLRGSRKPGGGTVEEKI